MSGPSIPDQAASLVNAMQQAKERISEVRRVDGEWIAMQMLLEDAGEMTQFGYGSQCYGPRNAKVSAVAVRRIAILN